MRWLLFLSRVALICNLFFIACLLLRFTNVSLSQDLNGFIIIVGYPLSLLINTVVNFTLFALAILKRDIVLPALLILFNLFTFILQLAYFLL
jgi:hypothetical protein